MQLKAVDAQKLTEMIGELEHLLERFRELSAYDGEAAAKGQGMLLYSF